MRAIYEGQCVGGPCDGEHHAMREARWSVDTWKIPAGGLGNLKPEDPPPIREEGFYVWGVYDNRWHWHGSPQTHVRHTRPPREG